MNTPVPENKGTRTSLILGACLTLLLMNASAAMALEPPDADGTRGAAFVLRTSSLDSSGNDNRSLKQDLKTLGHDTKKAVTHLKDRIKRKAKESGLHKSVRKAISKTKEVFHESINAMDKEVRKLTH